MPRFRIFLCLQLGLAGFLVLALVTLLVPRATYAQTTTENYQPQSIEEFIAYLYGIVAILEAQIKAQGGTVSGGSTVSGETKSDIETLSPTSVDEDDATLRGEVTMGTSDYAYLYFEYGTNSSLDDETKRVKTSNTAKVKSFSAEIDDLREDRKYYYRAVAKLANGKYLYGSTRSFSTDDDEDEDEDDDYRGDGDIELDDDSYKVGETIEVEVDAPSSVELGSGWLALFAIGASDSAYIGTKQYVTKRDQSFYFSTPRFPGKYEFRLFEDAGFNLESRSETFEIE